MFDLTTQDGVQAYLEKTPFTARSVVKLKGGYANFTYRITLQVPCTAPGLVGLIDTVIMKHAEPYVAEFKDMAFSVERQVFESSAFKLIPPLVAPSSIVCLPKLLYEDRTHGVIIMSDSGSESRTLKAVLQMGPLSEHLACSIGHELGTFIARLHTATRNPAPETPAYTTKAAFATNDQARSIVASMVFGNILPTFTDDPPILSPPLVLSRDTLSRLDGYAQKAQERVKTSTDVLNMGDYWTGNILLVLDPSMHVTVVDWEAARPGFAGMDLGQFLAELHLLRVFYPKSRACVDLIVSAFTAAYRTIALEDGHGCNAQQRLTETAHDTAARVGAHLITHTPRFPWGGPEMIREAVQDGVEYILRSLDRDEAWLRGSIVGGFWG